MLKTSAVLILLLSTGCTHSILKKTTYATELDLWEQGISEGVAASKPFLRHCTCTEGVFDTLECEALAENIVVSESLVPVLIARARYLGDLTKELPPDEDPEIPDPGILCPTEGE